MNTVFYRRDSWHYRLATVYADLSPYEEEVTVCSYRGHVLRGFVVVCVAILAGGVIAWIVGDTVAWLAASVLNLAWIYPLNLGATIAACAVGLHILAIGASAAVGYIRSVLDSDQTTPSHQQSLFRTLMRKHCHRVKFLPEEQDDDEPTTAHN